MKKFAKTKIKMAIVAVALVCSGGVFAADNCVNGNNLLPATSFNKANGYTLQYKEDGVCLYKKDGSDIYAQVVDLAAGANITFGLSDYKYNETLGNGKNAKMYDKDSIIDHFSESSSNNANLFSVINGQFFDTNRNPTFLSFPVKSNNQVFSNGPDMRDWNADKFRMLRVYTGNKSWSGDSNLAAVYPFWSQSIFENLSGNIIVGLNPDVRKGSTYTQRTFVAPIGLYSSEKFPVLVFLISKKAVTQNYMIAELKKWGTGESNMIMFDGGGSTLIKDKYSLQHNSGRHIPMVFEISTHK
jgi:hypothetical protein